MPSTPTVLHDVFAQLATVATTAAGQQAIHVLEDELDNLLKAESISAAVSNTVVTPGPIIDTTVTVPAITLPLVGFDDAALVLGDGAGGNFAQSLTFAPDAAGFHVTLNNVHPFSLKFASGRVRRAMKAGDAWVQADPPDVVVPIDGETISITSPTSGAPAISFSGTTVGLGAMLIGSTGIVIDAKTIQILTGDETNPPGGFTLGTKGVYIATADVYLPPVLRGLGPDLLNADHLLIGTGGLSGTITAKWTTGTKPITIGDFACDVQTLKFVFKQNALTEATLKCELTIPFFDNRVALDVSVGNDGALHATFSTEQPPASAGGGTYDNGLLKLEKTGIYKAELESVKFDLDAGVARLSLSGTVTPDVPGYAWPTLQIDELSVDSKGRVTFKGGWTPMPTSHTFDLHGAKIEITHFTMGVTDGGDRYVGLNGKLELIKGLPASASVDGLRIAWTSSGHVSVSFDGIGVSLKTKALEFDGSLGYQSGDGNKYTGDITVKIPAADDLELIGKAVFGIDGQQHKYFAIYLEGDFGTGIPLWATGLSLYGIAGLVAVNYGPNKPPAMPWYAIDHQDWFHPGNGVTDLSKWTTAPGTFAVGAGVTIGTAADNGHAFNGKFLLLLLFPGPVAMFYGGVSFLENRSAAGEPPFQALIVLDNRAGSFLVGFDARWKSDKAQGTLADISGSMEAFFDFHNAENWHLYLGKDPMDQRIQARFAQLYTAKAYFMLGAHRLRFGVWIGYSGSYKKGPAHASLDAYLDSNVDVNFKPAQFHGDLHLHGSIDVKVAKFSLGISLDAILSADVFHPYHILGELDFAIEAKV